MHLETAWWGSQIVADNDVDESLLRQVLQRTRCPEYGYEDGDMREMSKGEAIVGTDDDARFILEIRR